MDLLITLVTTINFSTLNPYIQNHLAINQYIMQGCWGDRKQPVMKIGQVKKLTRLAKLQPDDYCFSVSHHLLEGFCFCDYGRRTLNEASLEVV